MEDHPMAKSYSLEDTRSADAVERSRRQRVRKATQKGRKTKAPNRQTRRKRVVGTRDRNKPATGKQTKQQICLDLLNRPEGATVEELQAATSWQQHRVRGFLAGP